MAAGLVGSKTRERLGRWEGTLDDPVDVLEREKYDEVEMIVILSLIWLRVNYLFF